MLRALVLGSGFAGKGHTEALRFCGVEVVGMVSRTPEVVKQVGEDLNIPYTGTNWQAALDELEPDIVAIGTPGGVHFEPIMQALDKGCHVFCDKPLATTGEEAKSLYEKAKQVGVKTAYAASYRYEPHVLFARRLIADGAIGVPQEVECVSHYNLNPLIPFGWSHRLEMGGGRLNNNFTHKLSIVLHMLSGSVQSASGETRNDMPSAPVVEGVHDFRIREQFAPDDPDSVEWREANAEWSYTVLMRIATALSPDGAVSAMFKHGGLHPRFFDDSISIFGTDSAIVIKQAYAQGPLYLYDAEKGWQEQPVPSDIIEMLPDIDENTQRNWTQLMREFVADIEGQDAPDYQTFYDGWIFQEVIDIVRAAKGWVDLPQQA